MSISNFQKLKKINANKNLIKNDFKSPVSATT